MSEYGQKCYEAYSDHQGNKAHDGTPLATWDDLSPQLQKAWDAFGLASVEQGFGVADCYDQYLRQVDGKSYSGAPAPNFIFFERNRPDIAAAWTHAWKLWKSVVGMYEGIDLNQRLHRVELRPIHNNEKISIGATTEVCIDGVPIRSAKRVDISVQGGGVAVVKIEMYARISADLKSEVSLMPVVGSFTRVPVEGEPDPK